MRADKDFRTYEQALTIVQRFGEQAEADHKNGKRKEAQYNMSHAIFVGVKHLLFMAADASVDRAEARALAANNHLKIVELLSLTLAGVCVDDVDSDSDSDRRPAEAAKSKRQVRHAGPTGKGAKVAAAAQPVVRDNRSTSSSRDSGLRKRRR